MRADRRKGNWGFGVSQLDSDIDRLPDLGITGCPLAFGGAEQGFVAQSGVPAGRPGVCCGTLLE